MKIKIFGERNTATNALQRIVLENSDSVCVPSTPEEFPSFWNREVAIYKMALKYPLTKQLATIGLESRSDRIYRGTSDLLSWKHAATNFESVAVFDAVNVFILTRDPASWLLSLYKNPYHAKGHVPGSFRDFLFCDWTTRERDRLGGRTFTPIALYEKKLATYLNFKEQMLKYGINYRIIKFEDIILQQYEVFKNIQDYLLNPTTKFRQLDISTKTATKNLSYYQNYYGNREWQNEINDDLPLIKKSFSPDIAKEFGYSI